MTRKRRQLIVLIAYEAVVAILLLLRLRPGWFGIPDNPMEQLTEPLLWLLLFFLPVLLPYVQSLDLQLPGGSKVALKRLETRIEEETRRLDRMTYEAERIVHSLTSLLFTPHDGALPDVALRVSDRRTVVVGCAQFTEQRILCSMIAQLLRHHTDIDRVIPQYELGGAARNFVALARGSIDLFAHYTWTGYELLYPTLLAEHQARRRANELEPQEQIEELNRVFQRPPYPLKWTTYLGFQNNWEIVVREADARSMSLESISDLAGLDRRMVLGCEPEFRYRAGGLGVLSQPTPRGYGLEFRDTKLMDHADCYDALLDEDVDIVDGFTTDPELGKGPFAVLKDDRKLFGKYHAAIVARTAFLDACQGEHLEIEGVLELLPFTDEEVNGETPQERWQRDLAAMIKTVNRERRIGARIPLIESLTRQFLERRQLI